VAPAIMIAATASGNNNLVHIDI